MGFIMRSHRDRYRRRAREAIYRKIGLCAFFAFVVLIGYIVGQKAAGQEARQLARHIKEYEGRAHKAEQLALDLQSKFQTLSITYNQLQGRYERDVPKGDLGLLTSLIKEQLDKGLAVERMVQVIRAAQPPRNCTAPINKRVIAATPVYKGPESIATFADGLITVKGTGEASINKTQEKEAWFDPGKEVRVIFTIIGGKTEEKAGLLPLHHTIIFKGKEYRFTISEGPRSFIVITSDSCDYPEALTPPTKSYSTSSTDKVM